MNRCEAHFSSNIGKTIGSLDLTPLNIPVLMKNGQMHVVLTSKMRISLIKDFIIFT